MSTRRQSKSSGPGTLIARADMRFLIVTLMLTMSTSAVWAQDFEWAARIGSDFPPTAFPTGGEGDPLPGSVDTAAALAVSPDGHLHLTGKFERQVDFDLGPGEHYLEAVDDADTYVLELDADGGFVWAVQLGDEAFEGAFDIAADAQGNVYLAGWFSGTMDLDPGPGELVLTRENITGYLLKLNTDGAFVWVRIFETADLVQGLSLTAAATDLVHVSGRFEGATDFDPGPEVFELVPAGGSDGFVFALDAEDGDFVWAVHMGGSGSDAARNLAVDDTGHVWVAGSFEGTADFDPGPGVHELTSVGTSDMFVSKLTGDGELVWAGAMGGSQLDGVYDLVLHDDAAFVSGWFRSTADFDPGPGELNLTSEGMFDGFVVKLDADGGLTWARKVGGTGPDTLNATNVDEQGNTYSVGTYNPPVDFDPGPDSFILEGDTIFAWAFVWKLDGDGNFAWVRSLDGTTHVEPNDVGLDSQYNVLTVGNYNGPADFDPGAAIFQMPSEFIDGFVLKLSQPGAAPPGAVPDGDETPGEPLRIARQGESELVLQWEAACNATDYAIVAGTLPILDVMQYDHEPLSCSTDGLTEATLAMPGDSVYLLVVPHNGESEGSYGRDSSGAERPAANNPCHLQDIGNCI